MSVNKHLRSFVKRSGRLTNSQKLFFYNKENDLNYFNEKKIINYEELFNNKNKCILDIGFGDGKLLINIAKRFPDINFIGVEVYESGIGSILKDISDLNLKNIKIANIDAIELLKNNIKDKSLQGISLFFPDPWPKKKHFKRRLITTSFLKKIYSYLNFDGIIYIATDSETYTQAILKCIYDTKDLYCWSNQMKLHYSIKDYLNIETKFYKKAIISGRKPILFILKKI